MVSVGSAARWSDRPDAGRLIFGQGRLDAVPKEFHLLARTGVHNSLMPLDYAHIYGLTYLGTTPLFSTCANDRAYR